MCRGHARGVCAPCRLWSTTPRNLVLHEGACSRAWCAARAPRAPASSASVALGEASLADDLSAAAAAQEQKMEKGMAKWRWATAAQWAFAMTLTSSQNDLQVSTVQCCTV